MEQCELCGNKYDATVRKTIPPCPDCFEIKVSYPRLVMWITKVVDYAVRRAVWAAGEELFVHSRNNKHERNMHYQGYFS